MCARDWRGYIALIQTQGQTLAVDARRLWELEKGECIGVLSGHTAGVNSVAIDVAGRVAATCSADGTGRLWDLASCQCTHVLAGHGGSGLGAPLLSHAFCTGSRREGRAVEEA